MTEKELRSYVKNHPVFSEIINEINDKAHLTTTAEYKFVYLHCIDIIKKHLNQFLALCYLL